MYVPAPDEPVQDLGEINMTFEGETVQAEHRGATEGVAAGQFSLQSTLVSILIIQKDFNFFSVLNLLFNISSVWSFLFKNCHKNAFFGNIFQVLYEPINVSHFFYTICYIYILTEANTKLSMCQVKVQQKAIKAKLVL